MRARYPDADGYVERDGIRIFWERYGDGGPTFLLLPTWALVHSRIWKRQVHYLARHFRVVTFDPRGNGRSDRPRDAEAYELTELAGDALAVMDATGTGEAITVGLSMGALTGLVLGSLAPERVLGAVFIGSLYGVVDPMPGFAVQPFHEVRDRHEGWERFSRDFMLTDYAAFAEWWIRICVATKHSERLIEEAVEWALESDGDTISRTVGGGAPSDETAAESGWSCLADVFGGLGGLVRAVAQDVNWPVLVIEGGKDVIAPPHWARALAEDTRGELLLMPGSGHFPESRHPVPVNRALRAFARQVAPVAAATR
jgi:pimeloyl-ACP methyl ester carboxylesterase